MDDAIKRSKGKWFKVANKYRENLKITWDELKEMDRKTLKVIIYKYDTDLWERNIRDSKVLGFYALEKKFIGYEYCYSNDFNSKLYAKTRTNALQTEEHKGRGNKNYNTICKLCKEEPENLVHFIIKCKKLEGSRNYEILNKDIKDPEVRLRAFLFRNKNYKQVSKQIRDLWEHKKKLIKQILLKKIDKF